LWDGYYAAQNTRLLNRVKGAKGTDYSTPINIGEYGIKSGDFSKRGDDFNKADDVTIYYFIDGKEKEASFISNKMDGKINITAIGDKIRNN